MRAITKFEPKRITDNVGGEVDACHIAIAVIALIKIALQSFPKVVLFTAMSVTFKGPNRKRLKRREKRDI